MKPLHNYQSLGVGDQQPYMPSFSITGLNTECLNSEQGDSFGLVAQLFWAMVQQQMKKQVDN